MLNIILPVGIVKRNFAVMGVAQASSPPKLPKRYGFGIMRKRRRIASPNPRRFDCTPNAEGKESRATGNDIAPIAQVVSHTGLL